MRRGKRTLAGVAAGALGLALVPFVGVTTAQAAVNTIEIQFPSLTIINTADDSVAIGLTQKVNGVADDISSTETTLTLTNSTGGSALNTGSSIDDTKFTLDDSTPNFASGKVSVNLSNGDISSAPSWTNITPGTYTLTATVTNTSTGVAIASDSMPIAVVAAASAGTVAGSATFVKSASWSALPATSPAVYATGANVSADTYYVQFTNSAGGPIVGRDAMYTAVASPTSAGVNGTSLTGTSDYTTPGIYTFKASSDDTWSATPGAGTVKASFASPVNQIVGTLPVTLSATASMTSLKTTSAVSADQGGTLNPAADDSLSVPAKNGVSFTVSGVMTTGSTPAPTAGVNVVFTSTQVGGTNGTGGTSFSNIAPATATTVTSDASGAVSQTFTVANPVAGQGVRVTATYPGGSKNFFVGFATPTTANTTVDVANVTAANSGTLSVGATVTDSFKQPVANLPVQVTVTGIAATATPVALTTDAEGRVSYTLTVPAGTLSGASSTVSFAAWDGSSFPSSGNLVGTTAVSYTAGDVAVSTLTTVGGFNENNAGTWTALKDGALNTTKNPLYVNTQAVLTGSIDSGSDDFWSWGVRVTAKNSAGVALAGAPVTVTPEAGAFVLNASGVAQTERTVFTNASGYADVILTAINTGEFGYALSSGATTGTVKATFANRPTDARFVSISSSSSAIAPGAGAILTSKVTDRFGNPVPGVGLTVTAAGAGFIAGAGAVVTGADGTGQTSFVSLNGVTGVATITALGANTQTVNQPNAAPSTSDQTFASASLPLQLTNAVNSVSSANFETTPATITAVTVAGVAKGVDRDVVVIEVTDRAEPSIVIDGSRSGRTIFVEGLTQGLAEGTIVRPWIKFPGQTSYSQGVAQRSVIIFNADDELGQFAWQRRTGKKTYVYFKTEDGGTQSLRVIIPAR